MVLEFFPHLFGIGFFGSHGSVQRKNWFLAQVAVKPDPSVGARDTRARLRSGELASPSVLAFMVFVAAVYPELAEGPTACPEPRRVAGAIKRSQKDGICHRGTEDTQTRQFRRLIFLCELCASMAKEHHDRQTQGRTGG